MNKYLYILLCSLKVVLDFKSDPSFYSNKTMNHSTRQLVWQTGFPLYKLEIPLTKAAPAFGNLFMGCVLNINTIHTTVEKWTFEAFYWSSHLSSQNIYVQMPLYTITQRPKPCGGLLYCHFVYFLIIPRSQKPRRQPRIPRVYTYKDKEYLLKK